MSIVTVRELHNRTSTSRHDVLDMAIHASELGRKGLSNDQGNIRTN
jgi:hypothetical protein